jgi:hypothetical protein
VTSLGHLYLTSRRAYGDRAAAGSIYLTVIRDGAGRIDLSYVPPRAARPATSRIVASHDEALAVLDDLVVRMIQDHGAPGPEELSTDRDREHPRFELGASVRVVLGARNLTPHTGIVARRVWHHAHGCWTYFLAECGRPVKKRYLIEDLEDPSAGEA